jgi:hypothetical protein
MREEGGVVQQLVVSKTDATWLGPWEFSQSGGDWATMTESLVKNLKGHGCRLEGGVNRRFKTFTSGLTNAE